MSLDVVAAALVRGGRVLAARRRRHPNGWEFPGGKIEPGERPEDALVRELVEELGVRAVVGRVAAEADDGRIRLVLYVAESADEPHAGDDHDQLRWLPAEELDELAWLPIDRELLPAVAQLLQPSEER